MSGKTDEIFIRYNDNIESVKHMEDIISIQKKLPAGWLMDKFNVASHGRQGSEYRATLETFVKQLDSNAMTRMHMKTIIVAEAGKWEKNRIGKDERTKAVRLVVTHKGFAVIRYAKDFLKIIEKRELATKSTDEAIGEFLHTVES